jgi:hypothetical protein
MLKTTTAAGERWLIRQPDHALVSGFLAAHWGGDGLRPSEGGFVRPGFYAGEGGDERVRAETVFAIAEHDNGWWEWEAAPELDPADGLPLHLTRLIEKHPEQGYARWRTGVSRFVETRPYAALLISLHATRLYVPDLESDAAEAVAHPLFGRSGLGSSAPEDARRFVEEQEQLQAALIERLHATADWRATVESPQIQPHARLVQVLDALSLFLCFGAERPLALRHVPRASWEDRVEVTVEAASGNRVALKPYPFDMDPLPVGLLARRVPAGARAPAAESFATWWNAQLCRPIEFTLCSG